MSGVVGHRGVASWDLLARHGADYQEWYDTTLAAQGGGCYICDRPPGPKRLCVDHDHCCRSHPSNNTCSKCRRGLLCQPCNTYVGYIKDASWCMRRGAEYLERV